VNNFKRFLQTPTALAVLYSVNALLAVGLGIAAGTYANAGIDRDRAKIIDEVVQVHPHLRTMCESVQAAVPLALIMAAAVMFFLLAIIFLVMAVNSIRYGRFLKAGGEPDLWHAYCTDRASYNIIADTREYARRTSVRS
jgi:hypothetical protein